MRLEQILHGAADAAFSINLSGRIALWNEQARHLLGWSAAEAVGRFCGDVLACRDGTGRPLCSDQCPVLGALAQTRGTPSTPFMVRHRSGRYVRLTRSSIAVAADAGHQAVVLLQTYGASVMGVPLLDERFPPTAGMSAGQGAAGGAAQGSAGGAAQDAARGAASLEADIEEVLDRLLIISGAKVAELFVTLPANPDRLVLGVHRGQSRRAFCARTEFEWGVGLPGLAVKRGPVVSRDLSRDHRYLREEVKRKGFAMCISVPLPGIDRPLGSLQLTWPRSASPNADEQQFVFKLEEVAEYVGLLLQAGRLRLAERALGSDRNDSDSLMPSSYKLVHRVLGILSESAGADAAILKIASPTDVGLPPARAGMLSDREADKAIALCNPDKCTIARRGGGFFRPRSDASGSAPPCAEALGRWPHILCMPLQSRNRLLGTTLFLYRGSNIVPGRHVVPLHQIYRWAARSLYDAEVEVKVGVGAGVEIGAEVGAQAGANSGASPEFVPVFKTRSGSDSQRHFRPNTDAPLAIYVLGRFQVFKHGQPLSERDFSRRRSLEIFKILLAHYGESLHREQLIELLWPDYLPGAAEQSIKVAVHYLRRALAPDTGKHEPDYILTQDGGYAFNTETVHFFDVRAFFEACSAAHSAIERGNYALTTKAAVTATALYRGEFLLEEQYADWADAPRDNLRHVMLETLKVLATAHERTGAYEAAVDALVHALELDDAHEEVHRRLMGLYWRMGRRHEAVRQYEWCRRALARAFDLEPEFETTVLLQTIRASH